MKNIFQHNPDVFVPLWHKLKYLTARENEGWTICEPSQTPFLHFIIVEAAIS